jgi:hypothetical protein
MCVAWREADWLGPIGLRARSGDRSEVPSVAAMHPFSGEDDLGAFAGLEFAWRSAAPLAYRTTVRAYRDRPVLVFRLEASASMRGVATRLFDDPSVAWPWLRPDLRAAGGLPDGARAFGHQYTEFGMPTASDPSCANFFLLPFRPAVVEPLYFVAPDGRTLLLAPLDAFHDQVIAVPRGQGDAASGVRCAGTRPRRIRSFASTRRLGRRQPARVPRRLGRLPARATPNVGWPLRRRTRRASRTGPTTAPPTGIAASPGSTSPPPLSAPWRGCARPASRSAPCSSTRGSIRTRRPVP